LAFKPAAVEYKVDTQKSKIEWIGKKVTGEHRGEIKLASATPTPYFNKGTSASLRHLPFMLLYQAE
jgi:hypothetical protein